MATTVSTACDTLLKGGTIVQGGVHILEGVDPAIKQAVIKKVAGHSLTLLAADVPKLKKWGAWALGADSSPVFLNPGHGAEESKTASGSDALTVERAFAQVHKADDGTKSLVLKPFVDAAAIAGEVDGNVGPSIWVVVLKVSYKGIPVFLIASTTYSMLPASHLIPAGYTDGTKPLTAEVLANHPPFANAFAAYDVGTEGQATVKDCQARVQVELKTNADLGPVISKLYGGAVLTTTFDATGTGKTTLRLMTDAEKAHWAAKCEASKDIRCA